LLEIILGNEQLYIQEVPGVGMSIPCTADGIRYHDKLKIREYHVKLKAWKYHGKLTFR
jgi:hypothetical protein